MSQRFFRTGIVSGAILFFVLSLFFSIKSFTGYVAAEEINLEANFLATGFFLSGLFSAFFFFKKYRHARVLH